MDLLLAGLGMLACIALMAAVMPLAMRLGRRLTRPTATPPPGATSDSQPPDAPAPRPPRHEPS